MESTRLELEHHQLDLRYESLRLRREAAEQRLLGSLSAHGQQVPIVVVALAEEPSRFRVLDGFCRVRALKRLGLDTVWAIAWELPELEALLLCRGLRSAAETAIEQGWLLAELADHFALDGEQLARRFDKSPSWVSRRLALVRVLPQAVQEAVRQGRITPFAAMRHLVPLARAKPKACTELAEAMARQRLTTRESGELVRLWCRAERFHRPRILADPRLALRAGQQLDESPSVPQGLAWLRDLEDLVLAIERLRQAVPALDALGRRRAQAAVAEARQALTRLEQALAEALC